MRPVAPFFFRGRRTWGKASGNVDNEGLMPTWDSSLLPSARSSGTTPGTSPSPFQDRGGREGGVVAATSRDTITPHI